MVSYRFLTQHFETIIDFLRFGLSQAAENQLYYGHGTDNAWDDMLALILGSLGLPLDINPMLLQARLTNAEKELLCQKLEMRIQKRMPVPYLTNKAYFCGLEFYVDNRALIPRSPLAELIAQQFAPWIMPERVTKVLDLCTGSGCIAIACAYAFPEAQIDAVDLSLDALAVAEINKQTHQLQEQLTLLHSDCFDAVPSNQYDVIISNPPYVSAAEMQSLPTEYGHEPELALQAERDGLVVVEKILVNAKNYLAPHGILIVEVGNSEEQLITAFPNVPFTWLEFENGGQGVFLLTREQLLN